MNCKVSKSLKTNDIAPVHSRSHVTSHKKSTMASTNSTIDGSNDSLTPAFENKLSLDSTLSKTKGKKLETVDAQIHQTSSGKYQQQDHNIVNGDRKCENISSSSSTSDIPICQHHLTNVSSSQGSEGSLLSSTSQPNSLPNSLQESKHSSSSVYNGKCLIQALSNTSILASDTSLGSDFSSTDSSAYDAKARLNSASYSSINMPSSSESRSSAKFPSHPNGQLNEVKSSSVDLTKGQMEDVHYVNYENELQMDAIMKLIQKDLSEPYSIYTYRYFIHNWPKLCFLAIHKHEVVGAIVCKLDIHKKNTVRGYIAMLAVNEKYRKRKIGSNLVLRAIRAMAQDNADEVVLETEITNQSALQLYENLGFVRDKRLFRYYLNGVDALRLKLWLR